MTSGHLGFMQITRVVRSYRLDSQAEFVLGPYITSFRVKKKLFECVERSFPLSDSLKCRRKRLS